MAHREIDFELVQVADSKQTKITQSHQRQSQEMWEKCFPFLSKILSYVNVRFKNSFEWRTIYISEQPLWTTTTGYWYRAKSSHKIMNLSHKPIPILRIHDSILAARCNSCRRWGSATTASTRTNTSESFLFYIFFSLLNYIFISSARLAYQRILFSWCRVGCRLSIACTAHSICVKKK